LKIKTSAWGPAAFLFAVLGLLAASLGGPRSLSIGLAACGLAAVVLGAGVALRRPTVRDALWLWVGGAASGAILCLTLYAPDIVSDHWAKNRPVQESDPNRQVLVPIKEPMEDGEPPAAGQWADAATQGIRQDDVFVRVESAEIGRLPEKGDKPYLLVNLRVTQVRRERKVKFHGFVDEGLRPVLRDAVGHIYQYHGHRSRKPFQTKFDVALNIDHLLQFDVPPAGAQYLDLEVPAAAWGRAGVCRLRIRNFEPDQAPALPQLVAKYKEMLHRPADTRPDPALGRQIFTKVCMECHTLFGIGAKIGPELTDLKLPDGRLKRSDRDFLITNIVDPSAEIASEYRPSVVTTAAGLVLIGIVKQANPKVITLQTATKVVTVKQEDIEDFQVSKVSLMPTELLKTFDDHEVRSLIAYLSGEAQVPVLATHENVAYFFTGKDLNFWDFGRANWKLDQGELVAPGWLAVLTSDVLVADDFHLTLQFHPGKDGSGAIEIRGAGPDLLHIRCEAGAKLEMNVRGNDPFVRRVLKPEVGSTVRADAWNKIEIIVIGKRLQVRLNGRVEVDQEEDELPSRRVIALEGPKAVGRSVRFRNLDLRLLSANRRAN
jgi:putative heme-binding domain-containing protein